MSAASWKFVRLVRDIDKGAANLSQPAAHILATLALHAGADGSSYPGVPLLALETDPLAIRSARSFSANGREVLTKVILPSSVPYLVDGLRLGTGRGIVGVIIAELYVSREGIGFLIRQSSLNFQTATLIFGVVLVAVFGIVLSQVLIAIERRFAGWRQAGRAQG